MRFAKAHKDANHDSIKKELLALGFSVQELHMVGDGCPDMLIGRAGDMFLVELKSEIYYEVKNRKKPSLRKGKLEQSQIDWIENWRGAPIIIARSTEEILTAIYIQLSNTHKSYIT